MRRPMLPIALVAMLALAACARPPGADSSAADPSCAPFPIPSAVPSTFDAPADEAGQVVQAYGEAHSDQFAGVYFDNEHGHQLTARFTSCVELHQAALDALLGGPDRVLVLDAVFTEATLQAIVEDESLSQLAEHGIQLVSAGVSVTHNNVEILAKSDNPEAERILEALGPPGAIVVDLHPADKPWTQPTEGPGWRLFGVFDTQLPYTVAIAVDGAQLAMEWQRYALPDDPPAWDPSGEVVIFLSQGIGSTCKELRLDAVVFEVANSGLVYGQYSDPFQPRACTADLVGAKTFVVAVARDRLPPSPFRLQLNEEKMGCEPDCGSGRSTLIVDLR